MSVTVLPTVLGLLFASTPTTGEIPSGSTGLMGTFLGLSSLDHFGVILTPPPEASSYLVLLPTAEMNVL